MKRSTIRWLIAASSLLLLALVITQITWVRKAYRIDEQQFTYDVTQVLMNVVQLIQENSGDSVPIYDPVEQVSTNYFMVRIHDTLHPYYLESLLKMELKQVEINEDFEYNIYDCFTDSVVFQHTVTQDKEETHTHADMPRIEWDDDDGHYFSVFFPNRNTQFFDRFGFWVYSSVFSILVVIFFWYTISIILKQKRLSEITTDFINNMTHEFKTPISTIALSSDVLMQPQNSDPERMKNYASIIHQENQRLQNQVERILQIATIEKEQIRLNRQAVNLNEVVRKAGETFRLNVEAKGGTIAVTTDSKQPEIQGDEVHLLNIVCNLVDNAIKYSEGAPEVILRTEDTSASVRIYVSDKGIGIAPSEQKQIFDKFYRVPSGNVHNAKGFGIGLNYVQVMVEQHAGSIHVTSAPGEGSTFCVELPR